MSRIAYVNGRYVPHAEASVHIEDRGLVFADGVYEVIAVVAGRIVDEEAHFERLERSLQALAMRAPMGRAPLAVVCRQVVRRNRIDEGTLYLQINRGVAPRNHAFPAHVAPSLVVTARRLSFPRDAESVGGVDVVSAPDIRWGRCDIKSVSLLPNILAKQQAVEAQAFETWMVNEQGQITEGSSTNAWIVDREGRIITRPLGNDILAGITRMRLLRLAAEAGIPVVERPFTLAEAQAAREAFLTSTTSFVRPVVRIDGRVIGNGHPGETTVGLLARYIDFARSGTSDKVAASAA